MSGHSKWANIKHKKAREDAKRGKLFTKLAREITVAARGGGSDPEYNFTLRLAIDRAKDANMPNDNIERAIKRGTGELEGGELEEVIYEAYGPSGIAMLIQVVTDNRNRTVAEMRKVFNRKGGNMGESGSVKWQFDRKGRIVIKTDGADSEELALLAIDAGVEDFEIDGDILSVYTMATELEAVKNQLEGDGAEVADAELTMVPTTTIQPGQAPALKAMRLMEALEDLDDVQHVYTNLDISDELATRFEEAA
ncbi:MAG: putative transcriptional regulatory protein [Anaerolineales bacterium]|nr:putative transcriptional regulatory protein [Anaerolineales bacterium]